MLPVWPTDYYLLLAYTDTATDDNVISRYSKCHDTVWMDDALEFMVYPHATSADPVSQPATQRPATPGSASAEDRATPALRQLETEDRATLALRQCRLSVSELVHAYSLLAR